MEQDEIFTILGSEKEEIKNNILNIFLHTLRLKELEIEETIEYNKFENETKEEEEKLIKLIEEYKNNSEESKKTHIKDIIKNIKVIKTMQDQLYTKEAYKQGFKTCLEILFTLDTF